MKRLLIPIATAFGLLACAPQAGTGDSTSHGAEGATVSDTVYLGMGFDTETLQSREPCATGEERTEAQSLATWNFKKVEDWDTVKRDMGFELDGSYAFGLAKLTAKASFTRNLADTDLTSTYLLAADYVGTTKIFANGALPAPLVAEAATDKIAVRARCGDSFINRADVGGRLRVSLKFRFDNQSLKDTFNASSGFAATIAGINVNTNSMSQSEQDTSSVEIYVYQEGGDPTSLSKIMNPVSVVQCSLTDWAKCQSVIEGIISYSNTTFPGDIKNGNGRIFAYSTQKYYEVSYDPPPASVSDLRTATIVATESQDQDLLTVTYLLKSREVYVLDERKNELQNLQNLMTRNLSKLSSNLINCVEAPMDATRCVSIDTLALEPYDESRLSLGTQTVIGPFLGGDGGTLQHETCRNFMTGLVGQSGATFDRAAVVCDDGTVLDQLGGSESTYYNTSCPSGAVVTGMRGQRKNFWGSQLIGSLTLLCTDLDELKSAGADAAKAPVAVFGGQQSQGFEWSCPAGFAAVGAQMGVSSHIDRMALVCTNVGSP